MKGEDIEVLTALLERHGIAEFDYEDEKGSLSLSLGNSKAAVQAPAPSASGPGIIRAPFAGVFLCAHPASTDGEPALPLTVRQGDIVAFLKAGPMLRPVVAGRDCTLVRKLAAEKTLVGYGEPLFST